MYPELSDEELVFIIPKTAAGTEALALIDDDIISDVVPVRRLDGRVGRLVLTAAA